MDFKIEFWKRYVVMTVWVKRRRNSRFHNQICLTCKDQVYIRRRVTNKVCGSLIIYFNPNWEVTPSILEPSYLVMSILYQRLVFTLKSARTTVKKGLFTITDSWFNSKLLINDSKISWDWLGEWYNTMKLHSLILFLFRKNNFYFKMNAFLQVIDIFSFNWKGNIVVNTPCVTFKEWSSLYRL